MTQNEFNTRAARFTREQLRCDVTPGDGILALINAVGLSRYEALVTHYLASTGDRQAPVTFDANFSPPTGE